MSFAEFKNHQTYRATQWFLDGFIYGVSGDEPMPSKDYLGGYTEDIRNLSNLSNVLIADYRNAHIDEDNAEELESFIDLVDWYEVAVSILLFSYNELLETKPKKVKITDGTNSAKVSLTSEGSGNDLYAALRVNNVPVVWAEVDDDDHKVRIVVNLDQTDRDYLYANAHYLYNPLDGAEERAKKEVGE